MPWKETNKMEQKEVFIKEMLKQEKPFKHLCTEFGISEKTGHKWKNRYYEEGKKGLCEESRAPKTKPTSLTEDVVIQIIKIKTAHPYWGGKKIREIFRKTSPQLPLPSLSSVNRILDKAEMVKKRKIKAKPNESSVFRQHIQPQEVNDVWAIDFKGWWKSDGEICEPFTVRDLISKKILCIKLMESKSSKAVRTVMTELFKEYGLPKVIRSDNGTPFASPNGILSLTNLSAWWITLGIIPDRTEKGCPGQNGSLERMHRDISMEIEGKIKGGRIANQIAIDEWVKEYNSLRPNEAIGLKTPDEIYHSSERKYNGDFDEIEYPACFLPRKVCQNGTIKIKNIPINMGVSLAGLTVGLREKENNLYDVFLADFLLGTLDLNLSCFLPLDMIK